MPWSSSITRRLFLLLTGGVLAKLGLGPAIANEPEPQALTAAEILERTAKTYATCKTYQDSGCVTTVFYMAEGQNTTCRPFSTAFVRHGLFRFEFKHTNDDIKWYRFLVWSNGATTRTWWDIRTKDRYDESLYMALGAGYGISGGSSLNIPAFLQPDCIEFKPLTNFTELKRLDDGQLEGVACFRIQKSMAPGETIWIEKSRLLVRRIENEARFPWLSHRVDDDLRAGDGPTNRREAVAIRSARVGRRCSDASKACTLFFRRQP